MDGPLKSDLRFSRSARVAVTLALALGIAGCSGKHDARHRAVFEQADVDRSGQLSAAEFATLPLASATTEIELQLIKADADKNGVVSFEEFETTMRPEHRLLWAVGIFSAVSFVGSLIAIPIVVARLPEDHFVAQHQAADWVSSSFARRLWLVLKNFLGVLLVAGGLLMIVLPGQGVLTILLGVAVMDVPGKWKLMRALARRPQVMNALNWMRERADRPPMLPPLASQTSVARPHVE